MMLVYDYVEGLIELQDQGDAIMICDISDIEGMQDALGSDATELQAAMALYNRLSDGDDRDDDGYFMEPDSRDEHDPTL